MAKKKTPPQIAALAKITKKFTTESDRAVALITAAWVDDALTDLLKAYLVQEPKVIKEMFRLMGPLSSFSSKIKAAYLIGLIEKKQYDNLESIREIRNDFAHSREDLSFQDQSIKDRCGNLMLKDASNPRKAFAGTGLILASYYIERRGKIKPLAAVQPQELKAYFEKLAEMMKQSLDASNPNASQT